MIYSILITIIGVVQTYLVGYLTYSLIVKSKNIVKLNLLTLPFIFLLGCITMIFLSTILLVLGLLDWFVIAISITSFLGAANLIKSLAKNNSKFGEKKNIILIVVVFLFFIVIFIPKFASPISGWDAIAMWLVKAKSFALSNDFPNPLFLSNEFNHVHKDYPIGFSLLMSYFYRLDSHWIQSTIMIFLLQIPINLGIIVLSTIKKLFGFSNKWLILLTPIIFVSPFLITYGVSGYADLFISFCIAFSIALIINSQLTHEKRFLALSLLPSILGAMIKNEGLPFLLLNLIVVGILSLAKVNFSKKNFKNTLNYKHEIILIVFSTIPFILWFLVKAHEGYVNDLFGTAITFQTITTRLPIVLKIIASYTLRNVGIAFLIASTSLIITTLIHLIKRNFAVLFISALPIAQLGIYIFIYVTTPYNLQWHLDTSLDRTLLQVEFGIILVAPYSFYKLLKQKPQSH